MLPGTFQRMGGLVDLQLSRCRLASLALIPILELQDSYTMKEEDRELNLFSTLSEQLG